MTDGGHVPGEGLPEHLHAGPDPLGGPEGVAGVAPLQGVATDGGVIPNPAVPGNGLPGAVPPGVGVIPPQGQPQGAPGFAVPVPGAAVPGAAVPGGMAPGGMVPGTPMGEMPMAGMPMAGAPMAGGPMAGAPMAGMPGEGWAVDPGAPRPAFHFLDQPDQPDLLDDEDDVLLMPGPQGSWGEPMAPAAEGAHAAQLHDGTPVEPSWPPLDPPVLGAEQAQQPVQAAVPAQPSGQDPLTAAQAPRRPLHAGPPIPDPSLMTGQVPVRSLADRGPSQGGTPAHGIPVVGRPPMAEAAAPMAPAPQGVPVAPVPPVAEAQGVPLAPEAQPFPQPVEVPMPVEAVLAVETVGAIEVVEVVETAEAVDPAVAAAPVEAAPQAVVVEPVPAEAAQPVADPAGVPIVAPDAGVVVEPVAEVAPEAAAQQAPAELAAEVAAQVAEVAEPVAAEQAEAAAPAGQPRRISAFLAAPTPHGLPPVQAAAQAPVAEETATQQPAPIAAADAPQAVQPVEGVPSAEAVDTVVAAPEAGAELAVEAVVVAEAVAETAAGTGEMPSGQAVVEPVAEAATEAGQPQPDQAQVDTPAEPVAPQPVEAAVETPVEPVAEAAAPEQAEPQAVAEAAEPTAVPAEAGAETPVEPVAEPLVTPEAEPQPAAEVGPEPVAAAAAPAEAMLAEGAPVEAVPVEGAPEAVVEAAPETAEAPAAEGQPAGEPQPEEPAEPRGPAAVGYDEAGREAVHQVIRERRDIRNGFRPDPIPHEVLIRVLEAAHTAPSVGYSQPWDFVVIRSAKTRRHMHALAERQREAYADSLPKGRAKQFKEIKIEAILDTPVNIVVTADRTRGGRHTLGRHTQPQMAPYSAALAVENLWLAARAEGLGVGWVSFFDDEELVRELGLPEHLEVVAYLCVGYVDSFPDEPELEQQGWAKKRPLSWVVHEEQYGNRALPGEEPQDLLAETLRGIRPLDAKALGEAWDRQKRMTKPAGSLGMLEIISAQLCGLSRKCPPPIPEPACVAIFAGDHGVHAQGVTPWPQEVTAQMVGNFLAGGAVINAFAKQIGTEVCVVDVGVAAELPDAIQQGRTTGLLPRKVKPGTDDMTQGPAMTREEAVKAIEVGIETARDLVAAGNKALVTGDMGIANTTASAALISVFTGLDPAEVTGRGTGIDDETHARKVEVVRAALALHQPDPADPIGVLAAIGGLEHAAIAGFLLGAASLRTPVVLDGVIAGSAALAAKAIAPEVLAACIAGHRSAEPGHQAALAKLGLRPLIDLDLRLGEGTGALLALPLVQSAARAMHDVATFDSAGVTEKA
ncbi:nicotinate-nucleotide--dimethylbenzimidazole phosphoribosyltransferase [Kitasatospora sp. NPDC097643]|uniref:nicotinate-nucleotide--dimethylbenzimidazole phosphoribosyltransferase n=1 Tax=Kitasatospora sp. NPDC097643 TaxID=3157230 RepID=UPI00331B3560